MGDDKEGRKVIVVYYSLEGHCQKIAQYMASQFGFDTLALQPKKSLDANSSSKYLLGRLQILFNQSVALETLPEDLLHYDLIILGTPVWMGTFTPAVQTFIETVNLGNVPLALFTTFDKDAGEVLERLKNKLPQAKIIGEETLDLKRFSEVELFERVSNWLQSMSDNYGG